MGYDDLEEMDNMDLEVTDNMDDFDLDESDGTDDLDTEDLDDFDLDEPDGFDDLDTEDLDDFDMNASDEIGSAENMESPEKNEMSFRDSIKVENWKPAPGFENMDSHDVTDSSSDDVDDVKTHGDDGERIRDFER